MVKGTLAYSIFTSGIVLSVTVISGLLAARMLGPHARGDLAKVMFWPATFALLGNLSLPEAVVVEVSRCSELRQAEEASRAGIVLAVICSIVTIAVFIPVAPFLARDGSDGTLLWTLIFGLLFVPMNIIGSTAVSLDRARLNFTRINLQRVLVPAGYLAGLLLLNWKHAATVGTIVAVNCGLAISAFVWQIFRARTWIFGPNNSEWLRKIARRGVSFHGFAILSVLSSQIDRLFILVWASPSEIGVYVVSFTLATALVASLKTTLQSVGLPLISAERSNSRVIALLVLCTFAATLAATIVTVAVIPPLVPFLVGNGFAQSNGLVMGISIASAPLALRQLFVDILRSYGRSKATAIGEVFYISMFLVGAAIALWLKLSVQAVVVGLACANYCALTFYAVGLLWLRHTQSFRAVDPEYLNTI